MKAGRLRHRVTIQQSTQSRGVNGEVIDSWGTYAADVPAEVYPLSGKEYIAAGAQRGQVTAKVTVRYDSGITELMRLTFDGVTYAIHAVLPDPSARRHMTLMVSEGVTDGP